TVAQRHADGDLVLPAGQMRSGDAAREALALLRRRIGDHLRRSDQAKRLQRQELGIAGTDADAPDLDSVGAGPGVTAVHWVTGISGRQPRRPPTGSAREMAMRVRLPPSRVRAAATTASPSTVTTFATSRPPAGSADQQRSTRPFAPMPPPMK